MRNTLKNKLKAIWNSSFEERFLWVALPLITLVNLAILVMTLSIVSLLAVFFGGVFLWYMWKNVDRPEKEYKRYGG